MMNDEYMKMFYDLDIEYYDSAFIKNFNKELYSLFDSPSSNKYLHVPFEYNSYQYIFLNYIYKYKINSISTIRPKLLCVTNPKNSYININDILNKIYNILDIDVQSKVLNQLNIIESLNIITQDILVCDRKFLQNMCKTKKMTALIENYNIQYIFDNISGEHCKLFLDFCSNDIFSSNIKNPVTVCFINNNFYNDIFKYNNLIMNGFKYIKINEGIIKNRIKYNYTINKYNSVINILQNEYYNNLIIYINYDDLSKLITLLHHNDYSFMQITPILLYTNINEIMKSCMHRIFIISDIEMMHYMTSYDIIIMTDPLKCTMQYCNVLYNRFEKKNVYIFDDKESNLRDKIKNVFEL